jgi:hypothetical protein
MNTIKTPVPTVTTVSKVVNHRKINSGPLTRSTRSFSGIRFLSGILMAWCIVTPLAKTEAQVRMGLKMPSLEPRLVTKTDAAVPFLMPGTTLAFNGPDAIGGAAQPGFAGGADYFTNGTPLRAFAYGIDPLQVSSASAFQYNDVAIPESTVIGSLTGGVLSAQISGSASIRGFLYALGAAESSAGVDVEVLDITGTNAPAVVSSQRIAAYHAEHRLGGSVGGGVHLGGQAGFPYVGLEGGGSIDAALHLEPSLRFVRDDVAFGFMALLRRGHVYRVQIELSVDSSERLFGGLSIASFFSQESGGPVVPNPFDPSPTPGTKGAENSWLSLLTPMAGAIPDLQIAKGNADVVSRSVDGLGVTFSSSIWNESQDAVAAQLFGFLSPDEAARTYGGHALLSKIFATPPLSIEQLVMNSPFLTARNQGSFESIPQPGVAVSGLMITLDNDRVELAERATNQAIEDNLMQGGLIVSLYLPAAAGGELERCTDLVTSLVAQSKTAGLEVSQAENWLALAVQAERQGEYKLAYRRLHQAYADLTTEP